MRIGDAGPPRAPRGAQACHPTLDPSNPNALNRERPGILHHLLADSPELFVDGGIVSSGDACAFQTYYAADERRWGTIAGRWTTFCEHTANVQSGAIQRMIDIVIAVLALVLARGHQIYPSRSADAWSSARASKAVRIPSTPGFTSNGAR
jgi:hypothetical protein